MRRCQALSRRILGFEAQVEDYCAHKVGMAFTTAHSSLRSQAYQRGEEPRAADSTPLVAQTRLHLRVPLGIVACIESRSGLTGGEHRPPDGELTCIHRIANLFADSTFKAPIRRTACGSGAMKNHEYAAKKSLSN